MISFKEYISEDVKPFGYVGSEFKATDKDWIELFGSIKPLKSNEIIWRGFNYRGFGAIQVVTQDGRGFKGAILNDGKTGEIIKGLKIKNPAFGTHNKIKAKIFGKLTIMVPIKPFKAYQHPDIEDVAHTDKIGDDIDTIVSGYKKSMTNKKSEIIFDCKKYMVINPTHILDYTKYNKYRKVSSLSDLKTYNDVKNLVMDYRKQMEYDIKRTEKFRTGEKSKVDYSNWKSPLLNK